MFPRRPGPSSTVSGRPVSPTGSPGRRPDVSSYTWMTVFSPRTWMTSPMSCSSPTSTTSYIRGRRPIAVTTGPATRWIVPVSLTSAFVAFARAASSPTSLEQVHADRPPHLRPEVFVLCRTDRNHDGAGDRLEPSPHRVAQALHVRGAQDQDAHRRVLEDVGNLLLDVLLRTRDGASHADELEPLDEIVPAYRGDLHLTPPGALGSRRSRARSPSRERSAECSAPRGLSSGCSRGSGGSTADGDASTSSPRSGGPSRPSAGAPRPRWPRPARGRPRCRRRRNTRAGGPSARPCRAAPSRRVRPRSSRTLPEARFLGRRRLSRPRPGGVSSGSRCRSPAR